MEDYATYLAEEANSDVAALHQFRILFNENVKEYHLFFEGEDDSLFYMPEVRRRGPGMMLHMYDCGGKANVIEVRDSIKQDGYDPNRCLFFIDRDYDDLLGSQVVVDCNTYITDYYSIENYVACYDSLEVILQDVMRISKADPEFSAISTQVKSAFSKFVKEVHSLSAWILASKESKMKPNLRNTNGLAYVVEFSELGLPRRCPEGLKFLQKRLFGSEISPPTAMVRSWYRKLDPAESMLWTRGKYQIWFFHKAVMFALNASSLRRKAAGGKAYRIPSSLRDGHLFELLGGRIKAPSSLCDFLDRKIIEESA